MKKILCTMIIISILMGTLSVTSVVANAATTSAVTLTSLTCDSEETAVTAKMNFNTVLDGTVVLAVYDSFGKLLNVTYKDSPVTTGEFSMHLNGDQSYKNCAAKVFFMDDINDFKPVIAPIRGIVNGISVASNIAVVSGLSTTTDADGLTIFVVDYLQDGEEHYMLTTAEVYDTYAYNLTVGDVIKVKKMNDEITMIDFVFDFNEGVRSYNIDYGSSVSASVGTAGADEVFAGGAVTNYAERTETVTIGGVEYRLSKGVNFYTIDNSGRELEVTTDVVPTFTCLSEYIYDGMDTNNIVDSKGSTIQVNISDADVQNLYADYVYVRTFEDDIIDVIVVKGYDVIIE